MADTRVTPVSVNEPQQEDVRPGAPVPETPDAPEGGAAQRANSGWLLLVVMTATFMALMDSFIVNVAAPSIRTDTGASFAQIELVISGYVLVYGLLLITGGRLGDIKGYRPLFLLGVVVFTAASLACGLAPTPGTLIAFRVVQAVGAALFYPQVLSILQTAFTGRMRTRAFAVFGATIGGASIAGQLLGGVLIQADLWGLSWRPIFLVNVPIGALVIVGALATLPSVRSGSGTRLDLKGTLLLSVALLLLSVPLTEGHATGWPAWTWVMLVLSVPAFAAFVGWQRRLGARGGFPLTPPALFRRPTFTGGNILAVAFFAGNAGLFFVLAMHLQFGLGYSALEAGLTFTPLAVAFVIASLVAPRMAPRLGAHVLTLGYAVNVLGTVALLATLWAGGPDITGVMMIPALAVIGFGEGLGVSPLFGTVLSGVPENDAGSASGVLETAGQVGMSLGITGVGLVFFSVLGSASDVASYADAFTWALVGNTLLALLALALVPRLTRAERPAP
ncbi:Multidrug resistance protein Stp [Streptomyces sp. enrichment culture]|uniref:MFS transporter n=1 Tax=Streptomyces sp. enrichment culture TaxID=1795815 RepID=UPI003F56DFBD